MGLHQLVGLEVALGLQLARGQLVALHALGQEAQVDALDEVVQTVDGSLYGVGSRALDAGVECTAEPTLLCMNGTARLNFKNLKQDAYHNVDNYAFEVANEIREALKGFVGE